MSGGSVLRAPARLAAALGMPEVKEKWVKSQKVATLWAGYGSISEVTVTAPKEAGASPDGKQRLILKRVSPPASGSG